MYPLVLKFWFAEIEPRQWWEKDREFDQRIATRFGLLHAQATQCELYNWRTTALGRLAEVIVLDQFSRNMYRGRAGAFAHDALALALAQEAVAIGADLELEPMQRAFLYMPYMHSESKVVHEEALRLFQDTDALEWEIKHKAIIDRFGRYPHRNTILGRRSTDEERAFLQQPDSSF
ncbi:MAG: DUF924 domain-containing protein [Xanthomonadales bacterium]|nr:DUF924 domain-containing protein [Xanthomonadales bacterium]